MLKLIGHLRKFVKSRGPGRLSRFALLSTCLLAAAVGAAAATFTASLDNPTITLGESATLSLAFGGGQPQEEPSPPEIANLQIAYIGPSSQFSVINGQVSSSITYNFRVIPRQPGDYTIPAITAQVGTEKLTSQPLLLKVLKPNTPSPAAVNSGSQLAFLKLLVPKTNMYVGETVTAQLQLYFGSRVQNYGNFQLPPITADGFNVGKMVWGQRRQVQIGNGLYTVLPINFVLSAVKAGAYTIGPVTATVIVEVPSTNRRRDPFFEQFGMRDPFDRGEQQQVALVTEPQPMHSLAVPRENAPTNFNGAVGRYSMMVGAGPTNLAEGDPITIKVQISGRGAIESLNLPEFSWPNFKVHSPDTKVETTDQLGLQGTKTFEQIVTPENSDVKALPPIAFSFFDPDQKSYRTLTHPAVPLTVRPGGSAPVPSVYASARGKPEPPPPAQDIVPNKQRPGSLARIAPPLVQQSWFLAVQGIPVVALLSTVAWRRRVDSLANNPRLRRRRQVAQFVHNGLNDLRGLAAQNNSDDFFALVFRLLQEQLGERLDLPASAITEAVIEERLGPAGVEERVLAPLQEVFQICNLARYAPIKSSQELAALVPKLETVLNQVRELQL
jgi:hypothetical protein